MVDSIGSLFQRPDKPHRGAAELFFWGGRCSFCLSLFVFGPTKLARGLEIHLLCQGFSPSSKPINFPPSLCPPLGALPSPKLHGFVLLHSFLCSWLFLNVFLVEGKLLKPRVRIWKIYYASMEITFFELKCWEFYRFAAGKTYSFLAGIFKQ